MALHPPSAYLIDVCSGSGMLGVAVKCALDGRARVLAYIERESYAAAVVVARMEDKTLDPAPVWDDVHSATSGDFLAFVEGFRPLILCAGYPCQPFSVAGRRVGKDDPRHLWPSIARLIAATKPECVFLENVPGHLRLGFDDVRRDLEGQGYRVAAGLFGASEVGASHRRIRLFILALAQEPASSGRRWGGDHGSPGRGKRQVEVGGLRSALAVTDLGRFDQDDQELPREPQPHSARCRRGFLADSEDPNGRTGEPEGEGEAGEWGGGSRSIGGDMANAADSGFVAVRTPPRDHGQLDQGDKELANPSSGGLGVLRKPPEGDGQPHGGDEALADTNESGFCVARKSTTGHEDPSHRNDASGSVEGMADPCSEGFQNCEQSGTPDEGRGPHETASQFCRPLFAPGANDSRWPEILKREPSLAPCLESDIRGVADGMATSVRQDRLRLTGNGVVPLATAYAFVSLAAVLLDD
jgi:DNA (cytosine-5)-methyltransferase 1